MKTKKIIMSIIIFIAVISIVLVSRVLYINKSYQNIHSQRHHFTYQDLIDNGALNEVENYVLKNSEHLFPVNVDKRQVQKIILNLDTLKNIKHKNILLQKGFKTLTIEKGLDSVMQMELEKQYLTYGKTPTYHSISYFSEASQTKNTYYKKIDTLQNWYFWSYDNKEHGNDNFLEIGWITKYKEAQAFFKKNK